MKVNDLKAQISAGTQKTDEWITRPQGPSRGKIGPLWPGEVLTNIIIVIISWVMSLILFITGTIAYACTALEFSSRELLCAFMLIWLNLESAFESVPPEGKREVEKWPQGSRWAGPAAPRVPGAGSWGRPARLGGRCRQGLPAVAHHHGDLSTGSCCSPHPQEGVWRACFCCKSGQGWPLRSLKPQETLVSCTAFPSAPSRIQGPLQSMRSQASLRKVPGHPHALATVSHHPGKIQGLEERTR